MPECKRLRAWARVILQKCHSKGSDVNYLPLSPIVEKGICKIS